MLQPAQRVVSALPPLLLRPSALRALGLDHVHLLARPAVDGAAEPAGPRCATTRVLTAAPAVRRTFQRIARRVAHERAGGVVELLAGECSASLLSDVARFFKQKAL